MQKQTQGIFAQNITLYHIAPEVYQHRLGMFDMELDGTHSYSLSSRVLDDIPLLKQQIQACITDYAATVLGLLDTVNITESWLNSYEQDQTIHQHQHPNSIVSAVWYWDTEPTTIEFHNPAQATTWTFKLRSRFSDTVSVPVKQGDLLVWPSYLQHSAKATKNRKSLAVNSLPKIWGDRLWHS